MSDDRNSTDLPSLDQLKRQAKALRQALDAAGRSVSHGEALELIARQHGARDWNTLHARAGNRPPPAFSLGQRVRGTYLGQPFTGEIVALASRDAGAFTELSVHFDAPVNVVRFAGFSNFRRRITATIARDGRSPACTSDGLPHLVITG